MAEYHGLHWTCKSKNGGPGYVVAFASCIIKCFLVPKQQLRGQKLSKDTRESAT